MITISEIISQRERNYVNGNTRISEYVDYSQYQTIQRIEAYLNSVHISGNTDALERDKPFFNIVTAASNIWYRATDIDRKNIRFRATKLKHVVPAFIANILLQEWMKRADFGVFLNKWGRIQSTHGGAVSKFVEKDGELICSVIPWNKLISDDIDFENNVKIEKLFYTPAQLRTNKGYDQETVDKLISARQGRELIDGTRVDNLSDYIEVYEVQGLLPKSLLTGREEHKNVYSEQLHVVSFVGNDKKGDDTFVLFEGAVKQSPYLLDNLIPEDGRALGIGAVEHLFNAQWMVNDSAKMIKDQLEIASKLFFQTADETFLGRNTLTNLESGDIMIHKPNAPLTQVNGNSHDVTSLQSWSNQWQNLAKEITSTPDAISGNTQPSGTAYRTVAILNQESHSLFELMTENKGLSIERMCRKFIIPFLKKKMDNKDEITAILGDEQIKQIDAWYVPNEAIKRVNAKILDKVLNEGEIVTPGEQQEMLQTEATDIQAQLGTLGNQRFIVPSDVDDKTWKEWFKDFDWEIEVEVTNEQTDKEPMLTTLTTLLQSVATNPQILENPQTKRIFSKIVELSGAMSPVELSAPQAIGGA